MGCKSSRKGDQLVKPAVSAPKDSAAASHGKLAAGSGNYYEAKHAGENRMLAAPW